jgi:hypothetical protein
MAKRYGHSKLDFSFPSSARVSENWPHDLSIIANSFHLIFDLCDKSDENPQFSNNLSLHIYTYL